MVYKSDYLLSCTGGRLHLIETGDKIRLLRSQNYLVKLGVFTSQCSVLVLKMKAWEVVGEGSFQKPLCTLGVLSLSATHLILMESFPCSCGGR